eukprot:3115714-Amphidinium_carterae.1
MQYLEKHVVKRTELNARVRVVSHIQALARHVALSTCIFRKLSIICQDLRLTTIFRVQQVELGHAAIRKLEHELGISPTQVSSLEIKTAKVHQQTA